MILNDHKMKNYHGHIGFAVPMLLHKAITTSTLDGI